MATEEKKTRKMRLDIRLLEHVATPLYADRRDFLRELIQNSYGAKATRIEIETSPTEVVVRDNGDGMSYDFLEKDFLDVGKAFKKEDVGTGFYGIGRVSCWHKGLGTKGVVITSNNGHETTRMRWKSLEDLEDPEKIASVIPKGTEYRISISNPLSKDEVKDYVEKKIYAPIVVSVDGTQVPTIEKLSGAASVKGEVRQEILEGGEKRFVNKPFVYYCLPNTKNLQVLEKGFLIKELDTKIGGVVDFQSNVKTLSREDMILKEAKVKDAAVQAFVTEVFPKMSLSDREKLTSRVIEDVWYNSSSMYTLGEQMKPYLVFEGRSLTDIEKKFGPDKVVYTSDTKISTKAQRAVRKGYCVLVVPNASSMFRYSYGYRDVEDVPNDELAETVVHDKPKSKAEAVALDVCKDFVSEAREAIEELEKEMAEESSKGKSEGEVTHVAAIEDVAKELKELERTQATISLSDNVVEKRSDVEQQRFSVGGVAIGFGTHEDRRVSAFQQANKICLNRHNEYVQECMRNHRYDLLKEPMVHEMCHILGLKGHDEKFVSTYNAIIQRMYVKEARLHPAKRSVSKGSRVAQVCRLCGKEVPFGGKHEHLIKEHGFPRGTFTGKYFGLKGSGLEAKGKMPDYEFGKKESIKPTRGVDIV